MAINYTALKAELQTDPQGLGYADPLSRGETQVVANILNEPRQNITIRRANIMPAEVLEVLDNRDFIATPNAAHVAWFESVTQLPALRLVKDDGTDTRILGNLRRILENPGTQGSRARLTDIANRAGSRAEALFGRDTVIQSSDITIALQTGV